MKYLKTFEEAAPSNNEINVGFDPKGLILLKYGGKDYPYNIEAEGIKKIVLKKITKNNDGSWILECNITAGFMNVNKDIDLPAERVKEIMTQFENGMKTGKPPKSIFSKKRNPLGRDFTLNFAG